MENLEQLVQNIIAIDFDKLNWSKYDFTFNSDMLLEPDWQGSRHCKRVLKVSHENDLVFEVTKYSK